MAECNKNRAEVHIMDIEAIYALTTPNHVVHEFVSIDSEKNEQKYTYLYNN